ncbi:hypothetical protein MKY85_17585 [Paenibacillus sp. FSL R5-0749]|uniref:hypothetical protein n=1 Tax=Paenibacillus sp. FSL R5-0749 TaxID=2921657 RepID=UPI00315ADBF6
MMKITGLNNLEQQLKKISENVKKQVEGPVRFDELFNTTFMIENTDFSNINDFFESSPFEMKTKEDLENINERELDEYVAANTKFNLWSEMKQAAGAIYVKNKLSK